VFGRTSFTGKLRKTHTVVFTKKIDVNSSVLTLVGVTKELEIVFGFIEVYLKGLELISHWPITYVKLQSCKKYTSRELNIFSL
jgi:hypothetical protein